MRYKSDYSDKGQEAAAEEYKPTCGSFSSLPPSSFGGLTAEPQSSMIMGAVQPASTIPSAPLPTGYPTGGTATPLLPTISGQPSAIPLQGAQGMQGTMEMPLQTQLPVTVGSTLYIPGFLRTQIGKKMRVEFLVGTNGYTDRTGTLMAVGASYILLRPVGSDDIMMCDIYSIKFVTIFA